jgi:hypothetical protein
MFSSSIIPLTGCCPADWRAWWVAESERIGTNWIGVAEVVSSIMLRLASALSSWRYSSC